jgi:hypothetical protein
MTRSIREKWLEDGMKMLTLDIKDKTEEIERLRAALARYQETLDVTLVRDVVPTDEIDRLREVAKGARAILRHYIDPGHNQEDGCWNRFAAVVDEKP